MVDEQNRERGSRIHELKDSYFWNTLEEIRDHILRDLSKSLFMRCNPETPIFAEQQMGQIISHRAGQIEGIESFFSLLNEYDRVFLSNRKKGESNG